MKWWLVDISSRYVYAKVIGHKPRKREGKVGKKKERKVKGKTKGGEQTGGGHKAVGRRENVGERTGHKGKKRKKEMLQYN